MILQTCSVVKVEFASLTIFMDTSSDFESFVELTTIASPLATTSPAAVRLSLIELHDHLYHMRKECKDDVIGDDHMSKGTSDNKLTSLQAQHEALTNGLAMEAEAAIQMNDNEHLYESKTRICDIFTAEDDFYREKREIQRSLQRSHTNYFASDDLNESHSYCTQRGMLMECLVLKDKSMIHKCISTFYQGVNAGTDLLCDAIVLTVGITGSPFRTNFSSQLYALRNRLNDFPQSIGDLSITNKSKNSDARRKNVLDQRLELETVLMSLLMDDESLKTNSQFDALCGNHIDVNIEILLSKKHSTKSKLLFPKKLKFAEKMRRKKDSTKEAPSNNAISTTLLSSSAPSSEIAKIISDQMQVMSLAETDMKIKGYRGTRSERSCEMMKSPNRASRRIGREMAGFDFVPPATINHFNPTLSGSSPGFLASTSVSDATSVTATTVSTDSSASGSIPTLSGPSRDSSSMKRQLRRNKVMAASIANQRSHAWNAAVSMETGGLGQSPQKGIIGDLQSNFDPFSEDGEENFNGELSSLAKTTPTSEQTWETSIPIPAINPYIPGSRKLFIVMALNEDLSCTYRGSKMTSCAIQGIVQLQMKSESTAFVPFVVNIRDDDCHVRNIEANSDIANNLSHEVSAESMWKHKFIVTLPKADSYYPALKYTCSNGLVPVPLRVQSKVRINGLNCRVALQVSSNPSNEKRLTELSIFMTIPDNVSGESMTTQPEGGVWNEEKRSVMWCVKELGPGEKFLLQAQFSLFKTFANLGEDPRFPIIVRCQSMSAQLSSIVMDCSDAKGFPGDISTKIARRFRLSQRELE